MSYAGIPPRVKRILLAVLGVIVALALVLVAALSGGGDPGPQPTPTVSSPPTAPPVTPPTAPPVTPPTEPPVTPTTGPPGSFPSAASTGAPQEVGLPAGPCSLAAGKVYTGMDFACPKLEVRAGTVIRDSVIHGEVKGDPAGPGFQVWDSTIVGAGCVGAAAVGNSNFELHRVHIRGFNDGVRSEGPNVRVYDSLVEICFSQGGHADGLQVCPRSAGCGGSQDTSGLIFDHNTVTHPRADSTGAVFLMGGSSPGSLITDNLLAGFSITLRVHAPAVVTGNRIVADSWLYGPVDCDGAGTLTWSDNRLVELGEGGAVASVGAEVKC